MGGRLTRIFYGHVKNDPILASVFAEMSPEHPEWVAQWLGEVFGGPATYTNERGGYPHMLSRHLGRALTEQQRARWVQLMGEAADEASLPADPEFRSTCGTAMTTPTTSQRPGVTRVLVGDMTNRSLVIVYWPAPLATS